MNNASPNERSPRAASSPASGHIRGSTLLLSGRVISLGLNFAVQVLVVRCLTKLEFSAFAFALALVSIGASITTLGFDKTIARFGPIYHERRDYRSLFGAILLMMGTLLGLGVTLVLATFALGGRFGAALVSSPQTLNLLLLLILLVPVNALDSFLTAMFAAFADPRSIFFRRYLLGPGLKLAAVLLVIVAQGDVYLLAISYAVGGVLGVAVCLALLVRELRRAGLLAHFDRRRLKWPSRELFSFSLPLMSSDLAFLLKGSLVVLFLEFLLGGSSVAEYRAVFPLARLNEVVISTFGILFMPTAARLFAQRQNEAIDGLYWQTAAWITALSFPVFAACFVLAEPMTVLLFGPQYASSAPILALLSLGCYFNAMLGFNVHTLKVFGCVRFVVLSDLFAITLAVAANLALIPLYGVLGAAIATCLTQVVQNVVNQVGLSWQTGVRPFHSRCLGTYATIALTTAVLLQVQRIWSPPILVGLLLVAVGSAIVVVVNRKQLDIANTMPEIARVPLLGRVFG